MDRFLSKDFLSGVMFIAFGLTTLYFGRHLAVGTTVRMGPGYVPNMLSYILLVLGLIIAGIALLKGSEPVETPRLRPITMVTIGIVVFGLLFETTGLLPALAALVLLASLGGSEFKLTEVLANIVVLAILCVLVFKVGLGMNIAVLNGVW
ncbi:tripartite tricarboxylate transporter TctB family protein [Reyranella sp.]|uniref:tripartite tricarboxylate transporter TctB family protein n=1 Tax=Reyranella sp. TaxID=1929291 RepID=UPI002F95E5CB